MSARRRLSLPSTNSVLDEMYGTDEHQDTPATQRPQDPPAPEPSSAESAPAHTRGGRVSNTPHTRVQQGSDTPPTRRTSVRTPAGKKRHTVYISDEVAHELDDVADQLVNELQGLVPKHRVLGALITAGLREAPAVAAQLRAELVEGLKGS